MSSKSGFSWPWHYAFPPFFTIQVHAETRSRQLGLWRSLVLDFCQHHQVTKLDVQEAANGPLFHNRDIQRRLNSESIYLVLNSLKEHGNLEWEDPKTKKRAHIFWRTPEQWGELIYKHIAETGRQGTVCTFYELTEGDDVEGKPWHGLEEDMLLRALKTLESKRKAAVMGEDGVKFF